MARRNLARIFAPLALVAVVLATFLIYQQYRDNTRGDPETSTVPAATTKTTKSAKKTASAKRHKKRRVYVVKPGDILSVVAEETGVSVERLQELNPDIDPQSLQVGQRLKLAPNAETGDSTP